MKNHITKFAGLSAATAMILAAGAPLAAASAQDRLDADYEAQAEEYISSRMANPEGAEITVRGEPYAVRAQMADGREYDAWAVETDVRGDITSDVRTSGSYTVIYVDGQPVATEADLPRDVSRMRYEEEESLYAAR